MKGHRIILAFFVSLLFGACGADMAPPGDAEVRVGLAEVLDQYKQRVDSSRELIRMVGAMGVGHKFDLGSVEAACSDASEASALDILNDKVAFEREEAAQTRLADLLSGLLIGLDENRRLRVNPEYRNLKAKLSNEERQIGRARERYNSAARSHNEELHALPHSYYTGATHYLDKPLFTTAETPSHAPRRDFGALRGALQV